MIRSTAELYQKDADTMDWKKAEEHLSAMIDAYRSIGRAGLFALRYIKTVRNRYNAGERTAELYEMIMEIE